MSGQIDILKRARRAAFENILRRTTLSGYVPKSSKVRSIIVACQEDPDYHDYPGQNRNRCLGIHSVT